MILKPGYVQRSAETEKTKKVEGRINEKIIALRGKERLDLTKTDAQRNYTLSKVKWNYSLQKKRENLSTATFGCIHSVFTRHREDKGFITEFIAKGACQHHKSVYPESVPYPTKLKNELFNEFAMRQ